MSEQDKICDVTYAMLSPEAINARLEEAIKSNKSSRRPIQIEIRRYHPEEVGTWEVIRIFRRRAPEDMKKEVL